MRLPAFDTIQPADRPLALPLSLDLSGPRLGPWVLTLLLVPLAGLALAPFALLAAHAVEDGTAREAIAARPLATFQLGLGFVVLASVLTLAFARAFSGIGRRRQIEIAEGRVVVTDEALLGRRRWEGPLAEFIGLAHHVRSTLSGARHELILVHPDRNRSLLVRIAPRLSRSEVAAAAAALGLPEVEPGALYRRRPAGCVPPRAPERAIGATGHDPEPIVA
ncbi:MAG: hypothetical protein AB1749_09820 [Pseudomonadota bacterium]